MAANRKKIKVVDKKLGRSKAIGLAYMDENRIEIDPRQKSKEYLDTLIHEILHLFNPEWSETKVRKKANEMTELIWNKNYRRVDK